MLNANQLNIIDRADVDTVGSDQLTDAAKVSHCFHAKETQFADASKIPLSDAAEGPHCLLVGKTQVNVCFNPDGKNLSESLIRYFSSLKSGV